MEKSFAQRPKTMPSAAVNIGHINLTRKLCKKFLTNLLGDAIIHLCTENLAKEINHE